MNYTALAYTLGLLSASVILEILGTSKTGKTWFEQLRQPRFSFPFAVWYVVGGIYYLICGFIAYRLFDNSANPYFSLSLLLLILMMLANGLTNFLLFKFQSITGFYLSIYPFGLLLIALFLQLLRFDTISAAVLGLYLIWLIYDIYYFHSLWKLNKI